jgi:hypothetical protein
LDSGRIGNAAHQSVQGIDLADQMPLAQAADGRIAGHLSDRGKSVRDENRLRADSRRRRCRLAACMPAADNDHIVCSASHTATSGAVFISQLPMLKVYKIKLLVSRETG